MLDLRIRPEVEYVAIRNGLAALPRTDNHSPDQPVDARSLYTPPGHRNALDPDRTLIVGNRGMGKSFWTHALLDPAIRAEVARIYRQPPLTSVQVVIGFNASERVEDIAPTPTLVSDALRSGVRADAMWRVVLLRAVGKGMLAGDTFLDQCNWVTRQAEQYARLVTEADREFHDSGKKLLVVFDALDRLGDDWSQRQLLSRALLSSALTVKSYRAIRFKLFMRPDQYADSQLFTFPDASKIKNDRVDLAWHAQDLYGLLFLRLVESPEARVAFGHLVGLTNEDSLLDARDKLAYQSAEDQKEIVDALAGEFMGGGAKRGRVYTWLPTHLSDALGETSPRTFLTAWHVAARHGAPLQDKAVDHLGLSEGVRKASEDRLNELQQDYPWIRYVLEPLAGESVPMPWAHLKRIWRERKTGASILRESQFSGWLGSFTKSSGSETDPEDALINMLCTIGVFERRANDKVNVPDIFRVEARIKRRGGVRPPKTA